MMKRKIIKRLGGFTQEEMREQQENFAEKGRQQAYITLREEIRRRYGMPANQQLAELWTWLSDKIDNVKAE